MRETFVALPADAGAERAGLRPASARRLGLEPEEPVYVARPRDPSRSVWLPAWEPTDRVGPDGCALPPARLAELGAEAGEPVLLWSGRPPGPAMHVFAWTVDRAEDGAGGERAEDVVIVFDTSASMADGSLRAARRAIRLFVDSLRRTGRDDRLALVTFGGEAAAGVRVACPLRRDAFDGVAISAERCRAAGRTPMAHALERAAELLEAASDDGAEGRAGDRRGRVVLLSDGFPDEPRRAETVSERLRALGATVATVGVGAGFDRSLLATIAARTGGPFVEAARIRDLTRILEELSR